MTDPQGVGRMFPGTLGGQARPVQPQGPVPARRPTKRAAIIGPPVLYDGAAPFDYVTPTLTPPANAEAECYYHRTTVGTSLGTLYEGPGVTHGEYAGAPYFSNAIRFFVPGGFGLRFELNFWFSEVDSSNPTQIETRRLRLSVVRDSDLVEVVNTYQEETGTRYGPVKVQVQAGPIDILEPFTIYSYCLWNSTGGAYPQSPQNVLNALEPLGHAILVTGHLI